MKSRAVSEWRVALGDVVRGVRIRRGLTQTDVAARLNWARSTIAQIERGRQAMSCDQLFLLAGLYGVHVAELLPGIVERNGGRTY